VATGIVNIHGRDYKTVALRVSEFRENHPIKDGWAIITNAESTDDTVRVVAWIRHPDGQIVATGLAEEKRNATQINRTSALENCETSAIGRALAAAGYGGSEYASANEVENAISQQAEDPPPDSEIPPPSPPQDADPQRRFEAAVQELVNRGASAIAVLNTEGDPYEDMAKRVVRILKAHDADAVCDFTQRDAQLAFYRDLENTVKTLEQSADEIAEVGL